MTMGWKDAWLDDDGCDGRDTNGKDVGLVELLT